MANLYYIKRALYVLKRQYGFPLDLYKILKSQADLTTGRKTVTKQKFPVKRAILTTTAAVARKFAYDLTYLAANKNFVYGALYDTETISFLVDVQDLPRGFDLTLDDFAIYNHKRYKVEKFELLEHHLAFFLTLKETKGVTVNEVHDVNVNNALQLDQRSANEA